MSFSMGSFWSVLFLVFCATVVEGQTWKVAKDKQGVKIETRFIEGWSVKEYRATVTIQTSLAKAVEAYRDPKQRQQYMSNAEVSNLEDLSRNHFVSYYRGNAPWPVADRDNITRSKIYWSGQQVKITMECLPDYIPAKAGVVRIPRSKGYWLFKDLGNGSIKVTQQSVTDLGGNVPDWLVNSAIVDAPFDMLKAMKKVLEE